MTVAAATNCSTTSATGGTTSKHSSANISWRTATTPVPKEIDPAAVFDRLFGRGDKGEQGSARAKRDQYRRSILDFALEDAQRLQKQLGVNDQRKVDEYLFAVRDV